MWCEPWPLALDGLAEFVLSIILDCDRLQTSKNYTVSAYQILRLWQTITKQNQPLSYADINYDKNIIAAEQLMFLIAIMHVINYFNCVLMQFLLH